MKTYIVGNWKMNHGILEIKDFFSHLKELSSQSADTNYQVESSGAEKELWIAPQSLHLPLCLEEASKIFLSIEIGAQNCAQTKAGAYTGEISPYALKELGAQFVIIGHSERRALYHESHVLLNQKVKAALSAGLKVIFCVGESLEERNQQVYFEIVRQQLLRGLADLDPMQMKRLLLVAYEPVWAIGTGLTATPDQAQEMHAFIKNILAKNIFSSDDSETSPVPILYGGSVKPDNIKDLISRPDIHGALVGGASLKAESFWQLYQ